MVLYWLGVRRSRFTVRGSEAAARRSAWRVVSIRMNGTNGAHGTNGVHGKPGTANRELGDREPLSRASMVTAFEPGMECHHRQDDSSDKNIVG
jgi:hypothetical protein